MSKRFLGASPLPAVPEYDSVEASLAVSRCLLFCSGSLLRAQYFQLSMTALFGYSVTLVSRTKKTAMLLSLEEVVVTVMLLVAFLVTWVNS